MTGEKATVINGIFPCYNIHVLYIHYCTKLKSRLLIYTPTPPLKCHLIPILPAFPIYPFPFLKPLVYSLAWIRDCNLKINLTNNPARERTFIKNLFFKGLLCFNYMITKKFSHFNYLFRWKKMNSKKYT